MLGSGSCLIGVRRCVLVLSGHSQGLYAPAGSQVAVRAALAPRGPQIFLYTRSPLKTRLSYRFPKTRFRPTPNGCPQLLVNFGPAHAIFLPQIWQFSKFPIFKGPYLANQSPHDHVRPLTRCARVSSFTSYHHPRISARHSKVIARKPKPSKIENLKIF